MLELGAVIGLLGGAAEKYFTHRNLIAEEEMRHRHQIELTEKETEQLKIQGAQAIQVKESNLLLEANKLETETFKASIESDKATYSSGSSSKLLVFVDFLRGITRPGITWSLLFGCLLVDAYLLLSSTKVDVSLTAYWDYLHFMSATAITWWFGARASSVRK